MVTAMKQKETERLATLRMLKAALLNLAKESGEEGDLSDETVIGALQKEAKKRKESISAFQEAGRDDLVAQEQAELDIIDTYLPEAMPVEEIQAIVKEVVDSMDNPNFGAVMGAAMQKVAGRADGNAVRAVVQETLE